ncbi:unnamed protein product, partial [Rotaria magnacalcarata]
HYGELFCSNECASQRNNPSINTKLIQQNKLHQDPGINLTSHTRTSQHIKMIPASRKKPDPQQQRTKIKYNKKSFT